MIGLEILEQIDALQLKYIDALNNKDMDAWLNTFSQTGAYFCRTAEAEARGLDISFIYDDCRERLEDRVKFVTRVWAGTYQDYQMRHFTQRISCQLITDNCYQVRTNLLIAFTRSDNNQTELLAAGSYLDEIEVGANTAEFNSKKVIIDAPVLPHYIVYPL